MPRRIAVISDVHANRVALEAVLADCAEQGTREIVVAGDVVGFGPEPAAIVDRLREVGAQMIRGNHEKDYVAVYGTAAMPESWLVDPRLASFRWTMAELGPARRAFLAGLPDRLMIDEATLVVHGSPRHVRDAVVAWKSDEELEAMYAGDPSRLAFMGHTHRPLIRDLAARRLVNVGAVGMPLDGDPRAAYVVIESDGDPGAWRIEPRRVAYDVEVLLATYERVGLSDVDAGYVEIMRRQFRLGRDYYGPWLKQSREIPNDELPAALARYLDANP